MRRFAFLLILFVSAVAALPLSAARQEKGGQPDRDQWMTEMRQYKRAYFAKELGLSREQQNKFFPVYEEMDDRIFKINEDVRLMEKRVADLSNPTDLEYQKATEAMYDAKTQEAAIENEYAGKYKEILTPKQLFRLKAVERQFNRELMKQHHRLRSSKVRGADR